MAILEVGSVTVESGGGGYYFVPTSIPVGSVLLFSTGTDTTTNLTDDNDHGAMIGAAVPMSGGYAQASAYLFGRYDADPTKTFANRASGYVGSIPTATGGSRWLISLTSMAADGFMLYIVPGTSPVRFTLHWVAFHASIPAAMVQWTPASVGTLSFGGGSFKPTTLIHFGAYSQPSNSPGIHGNGLAFGLTATAGNSNSAAVAIKNDAGTGQVYRANNVGGAALVDLPHTDNGREAFISFGGYAADGFSVNVNQPPSVGTLRMATLALGGSLRSNLWGISRAGSPTGDTLALGRAEVSGGIAFGNSVPVGVLFTPDAALTIGAADLSGNEASILLTDVDDANSGRTYAVNSSTAWSMTRASGVLPEAWLIGPSAIDNGDGTESLDTTWTGFDPVSVYHSIAVFGEAVTAELSGTVVGGAGAAGTLKLTGKLESTVAGTSEASASKLVSAIPLEATETGHSAATATTLVSGAALTGTAVTSPSALSTGNLSAVLTVTGASGGTSNAYGVTLQSSAALSGVAHGTSGYYVWLGPVALFDGVSQGSGGVELAPLSTAAALTGTVVATVVFEDADPFDDILPPDPIPASFATAERLVMGHPLVGEAAGFSVLIAATSVPHDLTGETDAGTSEAGAWLRMEHVLSGTATAGDGAALMYETRPMPTVRAAGPDEYPGTINLIPNPSFEYPMVGINGIGVTGGDEGGVVPEQDQSQSWDGSTSALVAIPDETDQWTIVIPSVHALGTIEPTWFAGQVALLGDGGTATVRMEIVYADGGVNEYDPIDDILTVELPDPDQDEPWAVVEPYPVRSEGNRPVSHARIVIVMTNDGTSSRRLWIDGAQIEIDRGAGSTPFAHGDDPDGYHEWFGPEGYGLSVRQPRPVV